MVIWETAPLDTLQVGLKCWNIMLRFIHKTSQTSKKFQQKKTIKESGSLEHRMETLTGNNYVFVSWGHFFFFLLLSSVWIFCQVWLLCVCVANKKKQKKNCCKWIHFLWVVLHFDRIVRGPICSAMTVWEENYSIRSRLKGSLQRK